MECAVFSPCGKYWVRFRVQQDRIFIHVTEKQLSSSESGSPLSTRRPTLAATLDAKMIEEISTSAGVKKEFDTFANMIFNALIGKSPSVSFFIENCEEMKQRIRRTHAPTTATGNSASVEDDLHSHADNNGSHTSGVNTSTVSSSDEDSSRLHPKSNGISALEREFFLHRKFFTLDYSVDFTRAIFPVPLEPYSDEAHALEFSVARAERGGMDENGSGEHGDPELRQLVRKLTAENKKLKRENEALTMLSNEKMNEMQRICDDLQRRAISESEHRRLKKELSDANKRIQALEQLNEKLRREVQAASQQAKRSSPIRKPSPSSVGVAPPSSMSSASKRRGRFDTPPSSRDGVAVAGQYTTRRLSSPTGSRSSTPPRSPRPSWNQNHPTTVAKHSAGLHVSAHNSSQGSEERPYRSGSPYNRLYMMDTAASSNARKVRDANRVLYY